MMRLRILYYHNILSYMTTLSVPVTGGQIAFIQSFISAGHAENTAQVVRKGLDALAREEAIQSVLRSEQDICEGRLYAGDLDSIVTKLGL